MRFLVGNVDCGEILCRDQLEDVIKEVRRFVEQAKQGGRYILSDSNSIPAGCQPEAVLEMFSYARETGWYRTAEHKQDESAEAGEP